MLRALDMTNLLYIELKPHHVQSCQPITMKIAVRRKLEEWTKLEQLIQDTKLAAIHTICTYTRFLTSTAFRKASFNGSKELLVHSDRALLIPQDPFL